MDAEYLTRSGIRLLVGSVPRQELDRYLARHQPPMPPLKAYETWAGDTEWVPDHRDIDYLTQYQNWELRMIDDELGLVAGAITALDAPDYEALDGLRMVNVLTGNDWWDWLRFVALANDADRQQVVALVWYHSTVTVRGIAEAAQVFGVTWSDKPVSPWSRQTGKAKALPAFTHRRIAHKLGYRWDAFCALPGPVQSEIVCFFMLDDKINSRME